MSLGYLGSKLDRTFQFDIKNVVPRRHAVELEMYDFLS